MRYIWSAIFALFLAISFSSLADEGSSSRGDMACTLHNADVCYQNALDLHYGKTVPKDKKAAHEIFASLCEQKFSKACHAAVMSINRFSDRSDFEKSLYFQKIGCETGTARSCYVVGRNYASPWGTDMKANHVKAKAYFTRGCDLGMGMACGYAKVEATGHRLK